MAKKMSGNEGGGTVAAQTRRPARRPRGVPGRRGGGPSGRSALGERGFRPVEPRRFGIAAQCLRAHGNPPGVRRGPFTQSSRNGVTLGGYGILNLLGYWRFAPQWRLEARLLNALDKDVEPMRDYQGYGLQAWIGVRFDGKGF